MQVFNSFQEMQAGATVGGRSQSAMSVFNAGDTDMLQQVTDTLQKFQSPNRGGTEQVTLDYYEDTEVQQILDNIGRSQRILSDLWDWVIETEKEEAEYAQKEQADERAARLNPQDYGESGGDYGRDDVETYWDRRY